jgi:ACS family hexuronate transporter-like MFS transporter
MFPKSAVASVVGTGGLAGAIGGFFFPIVTGALLDHFKERGSVTTGYVILFDVCASAYLLTFGLNHLRAPRFEPMQFAKS